MAVEKFTADSSPRTIHRGENQGKFTPGTQLFARQFTAIKFRRDGFLKLAVRDIRTSEVKTEAY